MPTFRLSEIEHSKSIEGPICVVGAGVAGLLLARRLAQAGRRVVVVESGGKSFDAATHELNALHPGPRYVREMTGHYRGLGGSSTQWGGRMIPISAHETRSRPYLDLSEWALPYGALFSYRAEIERLMELSAGSFEEEALDVIDPAGTFPRGHPDFICRWAKWPDFARCNLANVLADDIEALEGLEIWLDATVTDFELDARSGRISAVTARSLNDRRLTVRADEFVFAAGTIETTRLLLWLDALSGQRAFERTQVLGRYFQDHLNVDLGAISRREPEITNRLFGYHFSGSTRRSLHLELSPLAQREDKVASAFVYVHMNLEGSVLETVKKMARGLQRREFNFSRTEAWSLARNAGVVARSAYWRFARRQLFVPQDVSLRLQACVEQVPDWNNRITLSNDRDRVGIPKAQLRWAPTASDERTFRSVVSRLTAYWRAAGFERLCPVDWVRQDGDPAAGFSARAEDYAHPSGTARMGRDPAQSIVGSDFRCHHIRNLSIVGAATFPSAGSANPTMTIMLHALHLGDVLQRGEAARAA